MSTKVKIRIAPSTVDDRQMVRLSLPPGHAYAIGDRTFNRGEVALVDPDEARELIWNRVAVPISNVNVNSGRRWREYPLRLAVDGR